MDMNVEPTKTKSPFQGKWPKKGDYPLAIIERKVKRNENIDWESVRLGTGDESLDGSRREGDG